MSNDDAVTWTQVLVIGTALFTFWVIGRLSKKITALEDRATEKAGAE